MTDPEVTRRAGELRAEAAGLPTLDEIRQLADRAVAHGGTPDMSIEEIRAVASQAVAQAEQVTILLLRLTDLLAPEVPGVSGER